MVLLQHTSDDDESVIRDRAARWVVRHDRGLSAAEAGEFEAWRDADPRHAAAFERSRASWDRFRELGASGRTRTPRRSFPTVLSDWRVMGGCAAAAVAAFLVYYTLPGSNRILPVQANPVAAVSLSPAPAVRLLPDGSGAQLRDDAEIELAFSTRERRVRLLRGEAFFSVTKDPTRSFVVEVDDVVVQAIGTAFAVRVDAQSVDVLVTEGTVQIMPPPSGAGATLPALLPLPPARVEAGFRAVVGREMDEEPRQVVVAAVPPAETARTLAWREPMLELRGATLRELAAGVAKHSGRSIQIEDPDLNAVRIGGRFPAGDVEGFIRVIGEVYQLRSEFRPDGTIVLRKATPADE